MPNAMLYHDNSAMTEVKYNPNQQEKLEVVAGQFEAMFLQMVLRQMRSASDVLSAEDSPFSSKEQGVYRDFYDGQLAIELARKQNSGIAEMLVRQLSPEQLGSVAQMVEPANGPFAETSPKTAQNQPLNINTASVAFDLQNLSGETSTWPEPVNSSAFQQPLIRKINSESL
ncbi:rod-binding protein [Vibrio albus]